MILTGILRFLRSLNPSSRMRSPEFLMKETRMSTRSAERISARSSLLSCGFAGAPVNRALWLSGVDGGVGSAFRPIARTPCRNSLLISTLSPTSVGLNLSSVARTAFTTSSCFVLASSSSTDSSVWSVSALRNCASRAGASSLPSLARSCSRPDALRASLSLWVMIAS